MDAQHALAGGIAELRKKRGWTQALLAERAGLSLQFVAAIEQAAKAPSLDSLDALASAFGVTTSALFAAGEAPTPKATPASKELLRVAAAVPKGHEQHAIDLLQVLSRAVSSVATRPASRSASPRSARSGR